MRNREQLIKIIMKTNINEKINLEKLGHRYLEYVRFDSWEHSKDKEISQTPYSWVAQTNSMYYHRTVFPMRTSTYVKFFKTLIGAKRNFIGCYLKEK